MTDLPIRLGLLLVIPLLTAGCLSTGPNLGQQPTATEAVSPGTSSVATDGHAAAMNQPDPDKSVRLENAWNETVELHVEVIRNATNETVHEDTYELAPDTRRTVYTVAAADPEGVEKFTVVVRGRNSTERVTIETNNCYGPAYAEVLEDGTLYLYYAIC